MESYRLRMYKRRLWEQRAKVVLMGSAIWLVLCLAVALIATAAR